MCICAICLGSIAIHSHPFCPAGTAELDLRGSPLEDGDVAQALRTLPALSVLQLSGCKKLTPSLTADLLFAQPRGNDRAGKGGLRCVTLQRCFQLTAAALSDVLAAAAQPGSRLATAALSHLSLAGWPAAGQASPPPGQLRMLALHNCDKLGPRVLEALAEACPRLEVLMLGGSVLLPEQPSEAGAGGGDSGDGAADADSPQGCQAADSQHQRFFDAALAALQDGDTAPALCSGFAAHVAGVAAQLAALVARLPHLQVLELTFGLPGLAAALQHLAATEPQLLARRAQPVAVWDLCSAASVADALAWRRTVRARWCAAGGRGAVAPCDAAALLYAAVNCSSGGRQTPLHAAADDCDTTQLQALLELGAQVGARVGWWSRWPAITAAPPAAARTAACRYRLWLTCRLPPAPIASFFSPLTALPGGRQGPLGRHRSLCRLRGGAHACRGVPAVCGRQRHAAQLGGRGAAVHCLPQGMGANCGPAAGALPAARRVVAGTAAV